MGAISVKDRAAERSKVFPAQMCRRAWRAQKAGHQRGFEGFSGRKSQKEIIEFSLLSLSSFLILTLVAIMFGRISDGVRDSEIRNGLSAAAGDLALALSQADSLADKNPDANFTIFLRFPREIAGKPYELSFSRANDLACRIGSDPPSCVRALGGGKIVYCPVRLSRAVVGEIFGTSAELAAVTYNSNEGMNLVLSVG